MNYEDIVKANALIKTTPIKGKDYAQVNQRVKAFRFNHPLGSIKTELISWESGSVLIKASAYDSEGRLLGTGYASEKEGSSAINKTNPIENCETSAVGRCLGFLGYGIDTAICSAEEMLRVSPEPETIPLFQKVEKKPEPTVQQNKVTMDMVFELANYYSDGMIKKMCEKEGVSQPIEISFDNFMKALEKGRENHRRRTDLLNPSGDTF